MNKTAIIIGATGLVGTKLVALLNQADHIDRVIIITRRPIEHSFEKVENHVIDFEQLETNKHLFVGDILFSCLGSTLKQAGSIEAQRVVDVDYQYTAARLANEQGINHYLLVSSSGAGNTSLSAYLRMKGELEVKIERLDFKYISILQPSLLLGERNQPRLAESIGGILLPMLCKLPGLKRYRPIYAEQVAQKMVSLSSNPGKTFERIRLGDVFPT